MILIPPVPPPFVPGPCFLFREWPSGSTAPSGELRFHAFFSFPRPFHFSFPFLFRPSLTTFAGACIIRRNNLRRHYDANEDSLQKPGLVIYSYVFLSLREYGRALAERWDTFSGDSPGVTVVQRPRFRFSPGEYLPDIDSTSAYTTRVLITAARY